MHSADELEKSVRITPPSVWVALVAFAALLAGLLAWGIFGTIATRVPTKTAVINGQALCFLSEGDIKKMHVGDEAEADGTKLKVSKISTLPISRSEASKIATGDYLVGALMTNPAISRKAGGKMTEGMLLPYKKVLEKK